MRTKGSSMLPFIIIAKQHSTKMSTPSIRYEMGNKIDSGAQGTVVSAIDTLTNKSVAIKIFSISDAAGAAGFASEFLIHKLMKGNSKRICQVLDSFQIPNKLGFIVMEKYQQDLFDLAFSQEKKLSKKQVKKIFKTVCRGVRDLHKNGIAHLDLKPENVLMNQDKEAFICDFGCSFVFEHETDAPTRMKRKLRKTIVENLRGRGTRRYAAPEVFTSDEFNPFSADIFSLGVIMHALLTGFFPATQPGNAELNLEVAKSKMDKDVFNLMCSMLMHDPSRRPTIEEVLENKWLRSRRNPEKLRKRTAKIVHFVSI